MRSTLTIAAVIIAASISFAHANPKAKDKIMTKDELRACMLEKQTNEAKAVEIEKNQASFKTEQKAVLAEQADVRKTGEELKKRADGLRQETDLLNSRINELRQTAEAAKTDEQKAAYEAERVKLSERGNVHAENAKKQNVDQEAYAKKLEGLNARITALNERGKNVNDGVEPLQEKRAVWAENCAARRYREDDEIALKKELGLKK